MSKAVLWKNSYLFATAWNDYVGGSGGISYRMMIPASAISASGRFVKITFDGFTTAYTSTISKAYIGHQSGSYYSFDGNQKQITFNGGSASALIASGGVTSDEIEFALDETKNLIISIYLTGSPWRMNIYNRVTGYGVSVSQSGDTASATVGPQSTYYTERVWLVRNIAAGLGVAASVPAFHSNTILSADVPVCHTNSFGLSADPTNSAVFATVSFNHAEVDMFHTTAFGSKIDTLHSVALCSQTIMCLTQSPGVDAPMFLTQEFNNLISVPVFATTEFLTHNGIVFKDMFLTTAFDSQSTIFASNDFRGIVSVSCFATNAILEYNETVFADMFLTTAFASAADVFCTNALIGERISVPVFASTEIQEETLVFVPVFATVNFDDPKPLKPTIPVTLPDGSIEEKFPNEAVTVLLDGMSILKRGVSCKVEHGEDAPHNRVDISAVTRDLFSAMNPKIKRQESRIEVRIGDRRMFFLLEERSGNEEDFSVNGRSLSARFDEPFYKDWRYTTDRDYSARLLCQKLLNDEEVDWRVIDSIIPKGTEFTGSPIKAIERIAEIQGAIVRCSDTGTVIVRKKEVTRPVEIPSETPAIVFDRTNIDKLDYNFQYGDHYTEVDVSGWQGDGEESPSIEEETDESPGEDEIVCDKEQKAKGAATKEKKIGDTVLIRVYWAGGKRPTRIRTYATSGGLRFMGSSYTTHKTRVEFKDHKGSVDKPISNLLTVEWIGTRGDGPGWTKFGKELYLTNAYVPKDDDKEAKSAFDAELAAETGPSIAIADVTYISEFDRYALIGSYEEQVVASLIYGEENGFETLTVRMQSKAVTRIAPAISDELIRTDVIGIARGTAFLDNVSYDKKTNAIGAAYHPDAIDGAVVSLDNEHLEITGNAKIIKVTTNINLPEIWQDMEVVQCQPL